MKKYFNTITKNYFRFTVIMLTASFTSSKKVAFQTSSIVPAARGVKITKDSTKNYLVEIKVENLAEVSRSVNKQPM
jgi:hypothetical protein